MDVKSLVNMRSTLSPDSNPLCTPSTLAKRAAARGIQLAALTDLNSSMNSPAFYAQSAGYSFACLFGMEAWTSDGFKTLVLFSGLRLAVDFCSAWYRTLPEEHSVNRQFYVDEGGEILGELKKNLKNRSTVCLETLRERAVSYGGILRYADPGQELCLNIGREGLFEADGHVNLQAVDRAFERLQVPQAVPLT